MTSCSVVQRAAGHDPNRRFAASTFIRELADIVPSQFVQAIMRFPTHLAKAGTKNWRGMLAGAGSIAESAFPNDIKLR
jgi:hypothetical protein